jgi:hypothetical protein
MMMGTFQARRLLVLVAAAAAIALPFHPGGARSAEPPAQDPATPGSSSDSRQGMDSVTVEAKRDGQLKSQISEFIAGLVVRYGNGSLERWNTPICPLVAGLPSERGEFILARISQIARDSHAPLAAEHCKPNLSVIVTDNPDLLVEEWSQRNRGLLNTCNGMGYIKAFLHSRQPVRVYYNGKCHPTAGNELVSRLRYSAVQELASVIIVVDSRRTTDLDIGQLADYVAMVGLAQVRADADSSEAPSILSLFGKPDPRPQGLSPWDQSFLHGLYTTNPSSALQVSTIRTSMFKQIGGH